MIGSIVGFIFGASPGLRATTGVAIATPLTFGLDFNAAMALLAAEATGDLPPGSAHYPGS
ncbi:tripartite tricarboxylate transporter permease [Martelella soudanensis]|uniref:tripartite tricarboxylate transporter permease n=1 Tax=Martelella sp. NC18 TaxID=2740297 RepID=UPI001FEFA86A|nr:tripartite tricarboxylate transporter permease [Martelella sp. NC18]